MGTSSLRSSVRTSLGVRTTDSSNEESKKRPFGSFLTFLAGDEGFEPPNGGTRTHCLTTWRIPIGVNIIISYLLDKIQIFAIILTEGSSLERRKCNSLKIKLDKIDHDSPKYYALKYEYDDVLEEQQNLECSVKYLEEEYNSSRAELKKYDD